MKLSSQLYVFSENNFTQKKMLEIGRICPDEILDITFENE